MECDFDLGMGLRNGVFSLTQFLLLGLRLYGFNLLFSRHWAQNGSGRTCPFGRFIFIHLKVEPR